MNILKPLESALEKMKINGWNCIYILVDLHGTIIKPNYNLEVYKFYPYAKETLQLLTQRSDIKLILWTCTTKEYIDKILKVLEENKIHIDYINENPETKPNPLTDPHSLSFESKLYFNVGLDDKMGFDATSDWEEIYKYLTMKKR